MDRRRTFRALLAIFGIMLLVVAADLLTDHQQGVGAMHLWVEGLLGALALVGIGVSARRYAELRAEKRRLRDQLETTREDAEQWRREAKDALEGLGEAIDRQFDRWELTPAEREVALFLLKGFSHKEIAGYRDVSDRTVRQQAHAVYDKADVSGRAELSAFFLEDLLVPSIDEKSNDGKSVDGENVDEDQTHPTDAEAPATA